MKQLTALTQIGHKKAERILEHREKNGPFEQPEDIMKVKGIGSKTFELNKDRIAVEWSNPSVSMKVRHLPLDKLV